VEHGWHKRDFEKNAVSGEGSKGFLIASTSLPGDKEIVGD
jgi:hypothetical protein